MVCPQGELPLIRLKTHDIGGYDAAWLREEIEEAAAEVGQGQAGFSSDVASSVVSYLENHFEENVIDLEDVASRVQSCLRGIGRSEVAEALQLGSPPVHIHLGEIRSRAGEGFELGFYGALGSRLRAVLHPGVRRLTLTGITGIGLGEEEVVNFIRETARQCAIEGELRITVT